MRLNRITWTVIWGVAISVTLLGGSWHVPTSAPSDWKFDIQVPGSFVVLYFGWFIGPLQAIMSPPVVCILTVLINVGVYCALAKMILLFRESMLAKGA
jgi:hypothetical protein